MPLSKPPVSGAAPRPPPQRPEELLAILRSAASETDRRDAALELAGVPDASAALAAALQEEAAPRVREAIVTALIALATPAAAEGLAACLRSEDVALRNEAIVALRQMGAATGMALRPLLDSPDYDHRLLAIQALHASRHPQAQAWLAEILEQETEVNIGLAAVEALAQCGGPDSVPLLQAFAARFTHEPFVAFAVAVACRQASADGIK